MTINILYFQIEVVQQSYTGYFKFDPHYWDLENSIEIRESLNWGKVAQFKAEPNEILKI